MPCSRFANPYAFAKTTDPFVATKTAPLNSCAFINFVRYTSACELKEDSAGACKAPAMMTVHAAKMRNRRFMLWDEQRTSESYGKGAGLLEAFVSTMKNSEE